MKQKYQITRDKFMDKEQVTRLLKVCDEMAQLDLLLGRQTWITRNMLVNVALRTGMRCNEIRNLTISDLHLNGRENWLHVSHAKGGRVRDVYVNAVLAKQLKHYIEIKRRAGQPCDDDRYLFSHGEDGQRYTTTALHISFKAALTKAGIPVSGWVGERGKKVAPWDGGKKKRGFSIHSARHSYATLLLGDTGDIRAVQAQLGHSSISMTSLYAQCLPEHRQAVADKFSI
jgi:integrase